MATNIEVIVGTYEEFLLGYKVEKKSENDEKYSLHQSFAVHAHTGSVRCVHTKGKYLASGGADDRIFVYDMKTRQEVQLLTHHNGVVNHLRFTPDCTHLFAGSSDGAVSATRTGSWISEGYWKAPHGGKAVIYVSIHPSGKIALTLGADLTLKTWNLIKGRAIFTTNLKSKSELGRVADCVEWSPNGQYFTLTGAKVIEVWHIQTAGIAKEVQCECKPTSVCWIDEKTQCVGLNNGKLLMFSLDDEEQKTFELHKSRIKGIYYQNGYLASISSDGDVSVWSVAPTDKTVTNIATTNIGCRPICVTIINLADFADEYVLKIEDDDEEVEEQKSSGKTGSAMTKLNAQVGKVIEEHDDDNDEDEVKQKTVKKSGMEGQNNNSDKKSNNSQHSSLVQKQKRQSLNNSTEATTPNSAKKSKKSNERQSSSNFKEEDNV